MAEQALNSLLDDVILEVVLEMHRKLVSGKLCLACPSPATDLVALAGHDVSLAHVRRHTLTLFACAGQRPLVSRRLGGCPVAVRQLRSSNAPFFFLPSLLCLLSLVRHLFVCAAHCLDSLCAPPRKVSGSRRPRNAFAPSSGHGGGRSGCVSRRLFCFLFVFSFRPGHCWQNA